MSAGITARAQGSRVEVEGLRTERSTTWVNPDGSLTTEEHAGPVRYKDENGRWQSVDLDVAPPVADGSAPVEAHPAQVAFGGSDGSDGIIAAAGAPGRRVSLGWGRKLGRPMVSGRTARWVEAAPGVDITAQSRRSGFEALLTVKSATAVSTAKSAAGVVSWSLPLKTHGLTARVAADGGVEFTDAKGTIVSRLAPMTAWDAQVDASGGPASVVKVTPSVVQRGAGRAVLTLTPDQAWVASVKSRGVV